MFSSEENLLRHKPTHEKTNKTIQPSVQKATCHICGKSCWHLKQHLDGHNGLRKTEFECDLCDKVYSQDAKLKHHKLSFHYKVLHKCHLCDKGFTTVFGLKTHLESIHDRKSHKCLFCEKIYSHKVDLNGHIRAVHEGKKSQCKFCGKEFLRSSEKNRHERTVHKVDSDASH
jgi:hypothetical protein